MPTKEYISVAIEVTEINIPTGNKVREKPGRSCGNIQELDRSQTRRAEETSQPYKSH